MGIEIERKFLLPDGEPSLRASQFLERGSLWQYYTRIDTHGEDRYRLVDEARAVFTTKGKGDLDRPELNTEIPTSDYFTNLAKMLPGTRELRKLRIAVSLSDQIEIATVDIYTEKPYRGLVLTEVEFDPKHYGDDVELTKQIAMAFKLPADFGRSIDVTFDKRFKNSSVAKDIPALNAV